MAGSASTEPGQLEGSPDLSQHEFSTAAAGPIIADSSQPSGSQEPESNATPALPEFQEVFVGGLPSDITEEDVTETFSTIGEVLCVRLNRRRKTGECKGFAFVRFKNQETAEMACRDITKVRGEEVGVHISRPRQTETSEDALLLAGLDSEGGINKLLGLIHSHPDRKAAIAAAIRAVVSLQPRRNGHRNGGTDVTRSGDDPDGLDDSLPDPNTFLDKFSKCKKLVERFRENPNTSNKTPLAILHEYATRLNLELQYEQNADSNLGPFTTGAHLKSAGGAVSYATGEGRGRSKKEAKQVTAAAVLENLLDSVPMDNFLQSTKKMPVRGANFSGVRGVGIRGRGRGRGGSLGRLNQGLDYLPPFNYPTGQNAAFDLALASPAALQQHSQSLNAQDALGSFSSAHSQRLRNYLAQRPSDLDVLNNLRGHSLDTAMANQQRQLAAAFPTDVRQSEMQDAALGAYGNSRSFDNSAFSIGSGNNDGQQEALLRQRQVPFPQPLPIMPEVAFSNLPQSNTNLFDPQSFHNRNASPHLNFQRY